MYGSNPGCAQMSEVRRVVLLGMTTTPGRSGIVTRKGHEKGFWGTGNVLLLNEVGTWVFGSKKCMELLTYNKQLSFSIKTFKKMSGIGIPS